MEQLHKFLTKYLRTVGGPQALHMLDVLATGGVAALQQSYVPQPRQFRTSADYGQAALAYGIVEKLRLPSDDRARTLRTMADFWKSEHQCHITNRRLRRYQGQLTGMIPVEPEDMHMLMLIEEWRRELRAALGPLPLRLEPAFSGGSTLSDAGKQTTIPHKLSSVPTVYPGGNAIWAHSVQNTVLDARRPLAVSHNQYFEVPKNSEKNRGCCMEASGSLMLQLAVGSVMKKRYRRRYQVDLRYAKPIHMALARDASRTGQWATIDLSRASDTVARELVKLLLPPIWYDLLKSLRASHTDLGGRRVYLEKFSSMGNGFTFELETMIFRSLLAVLTTQPAYVFGDDIIVQSGLGPTVMRILEHFGFTPNMKKTFCEGPFRESCGGDYFDGQAVRPHYLKEPPTEPQHWVSLANGLHRVGLGKTAPWWFCVDQLPVSWRNFGPAQLFDGCINVDDPKPLMRESKCEEGYLRPFWPVMVPVSRKLKLGVHFGYAEACAAACLGVKSQVSLRDSVTGHRKRFINAWGQATDDISRLLREQAENT